MLNMLVAASDGCHDVNIVLDMVRRLLEMVNATHFDWTGAAYHQDWKNMYENVMRLCEHVWQVLVAPGGDESYGTASSMHGWLDILDELVLGFGP